MRLLHISVCFIPLTIATAQTSIATVIGTRPEGQLGTVVRAAGDVDGDGVPDFVIGEPGNSTADGGRCYVISGATRAVLRTFQGQTAGGMWGLGSTDINAIGDVDGDGHQDFAIGYVNIGALDVFSGATGTRLYRLGTSLQYRQNACGVGDLDGDGHDDFVAMVYISSQTQIWAIRGVAGTQLSTVAATTQAGQFLCNIGDINGDGFPEVAACGGQFIEIYSLHPAQLLRQISIGGGPIIGCEVIDVNHDGHMDILLSYQGSASVYSTLNGALLRTYSIANGGNFSHLSLLHDVDGDGTDDLAVIGGPDPIVGGGVVVVSGQTGSVLGGWAVQPQLPWPLQVAGVGDIDGDGFDDFVLGMPNAGPNHEGGWQLISGRLLGSMTTQPVNCYGGPFPPQLGVTRPVLGSTMTVAGRDAPFAAPGAFAMSFIPTLPTNLGASGCNAWLDLPTTVILGWLPPSPSWQVGVPIPNQRTLIGTQLALQAFYVGTNGPLGYDLTNGIWARVGY
jgi:hypothetical protein